jgi:hypothetical protein
LTCFIYFLFLLPSTYVSFIGPYTFQFRPPLSSFCIINFRYVFLYLFTVLHLYHPSKFSFLRFCLLCVFFYFLSISRIFFSIIFISQSILPPQFLRFAFMFILVLYFSSFSAFIFYISKPRSCYHPFCATFHNLSISLSFSQTPSCLRLSIFFLTLKSSTSQSLDSHHGVPGSLPGRN